MQKEIIIDTNKREEIIDITNLINKNININKGIINIFTTHTTTALTINESSDPNLPIDLTNFLNKLVQKNIWLHDKIDGNADSHIKASLVGNSVTIPINNNKMLLGNWQRILFCEFDGKRKRKILITSIKN
ncbi:MAG: secondary thiamine-phosphate synthase enzyme YjbQ [Nanoarchaeota archaeon]